MTEGKQIPDADGWWVVKDRHCAEFEIHQVEIVNGVAFRVTHPIGGTAKIRIDLEKRPRSWLFRIQEPADARAVRNATRDCIALLSQHFVSNERKSEDSVAIPVEVLSKLSSFLNDIEATMDYYANA